MFITWNTWASFASWIISPKEWVSAMAHRMATRSLRKRSTASPCERGPILICSSTFSR